MDSFVEIELFQESAYAPGQPIEGKLHLFAKNQVNDVSRITLTFHGQEQISCRIDPENTKILHENEIIEQTFCVHDYAELYNVVQGGSYCFPFTLWIPEWLPSSSLCYHQELPRK